MLSVRSAWRALRSRGWELLDTAASTVFVPGQAAAGIPEMITRILVIRTDNIGDVVLSTPALQALRSRFPRAQIHLLVSPHTEALLRRNPWTDKVLAVGRDAFEPPYDIAFVLHPGLGPNLLAWQNRARIRVGFRGEGGAFLLTRALPDDRHLRLRHEVYTILEVVATAGARLDDPAPSLEVTTQGEEEADAFLDSQGLADDGILVALHPGSRQEYLRWPEERFIALGQSLCQETNAHILLTASGKELALAERIRNGIGAHAHVAALSLTGLVSLLRRCRLMVSNSTGPMHIAAAVQTPTVGIFGCLHPRDSWQAWHPWGPKHCAIHAHISCTLAHPGDCRQARCLEEISVEKVLTECLRLLKGTSTPCA